MPISDPGGVNVDDTTVEINAQGQLQIKDGGVDTAQLADAGVTDAKIGAPVMKLIGSAELGSNNANLTVTESALADYDFLRVVVRFGTNGSTGILRIRLCGATSGYKYDYSRMEGGAFSAGNSSTSASYIQCSDKISNEEGNICVFDISKDGSLYGVTGILSNSQLTDTSVFTGRLSSGATFDTIQFGIHATYVLQAGARMEVYGVNSV